jgi:hypothetical protein
MPRLQSRYVIISHIGWFICFVLLAGCAKKITERSLPFKNIGPASDRHVVQMTGASRTDSLQILYLGCGHLVMQFKDEIISIDPYFSIQPFTPGKKIKTNTVDYTKWLQAVGRHKMDLKKTKSIWLAHSHYDHMMDLPFMMEKNHFTDSLKIYGSEDGTRTFTNFKNVLSRYQVLAESQVFVPNAAATPTPIAAGKNIEVLPIRSDHAPHFKFLGITFHLMKGRVKRKYFEDHYDDVRDKTKKSQWREGATYSFLIDFKTGTRIDYRVFVQTSGSHFPLGKPPEGLLKQRPVDVALLCLASSNYAKPYPVEIMQYLNRFSSPKYMFIHWEDFFTRGSFDNYKLVRLTNFRKIARRLTKSTISLNPANDVMPQPGTMVVVK